MVGMTTRSESTETPWTIGRLLQWTADYLTRHGVEEARLSTEVLLAHAVGCPRIQLYTRFEESINGTRIDGFRELVKRAARLEPIAYLVEQKEFYSLSFRVTRDVLIPRPETESLVECVVDECSRARLKSPVLWDMGTGSGCIAIALLKQLPTATVTATDISAPALEVARHNAERHGVQDRLTLLMADRLTLPANQVTPGGFDALVSNPPYVAQVTLSMLPRSVREFEPAIALTDGDDGLSFYRGIAADGAGWLTEDGAVFVEIADGAHDAVISTMTSTGIFSHERSWKDRVTGRERISMYRRTARSEVSR